MRVNGKSSVGGKDKDGEPKVRRKPGRVPTSCAECRRLKLRCDKSVPCEKCVSRGCGSICPDGSLAPGKGNRLVLANTEELHDRIELQCNRIRELESALRALQGKVSDEPHSLLQPNELQILRAPSTVLPTSSAGLPLASETGEHVEAPVTRFEDENFVDSFGTLALGLRGECSFLGGTARSKYLTHALAQPRNRTHHSSTRLPKRMMEPTFPEAEISDENLGQEVFSLLPSPSEALRLCEIYQEHGKYMYTPVPRTELFEDILARVYRAESFDSVQCHHSLALLLITFAIATLFDPDRQPYSTEAQEYYYLARTTLGLAPQTTRLSVQAFIHIAQYLELSDWDSSGSNSAWMYVGHAVRLGHSIGLHLNSARWKLSSDDVRRRSRLFWQLFALDTWTSFSFGRPPTMSSSYIDCPLPKDVDQTDHPAGQEQMSFHSWNWQYSVLLHSIMATAFGPKLPAYSVIIALDRRVRDFPVPSYWRPTCEGGTLPEHAALPEVHMQRWLVLASKESTLLNLHRAYFAQALSEQPTDLAKHRYIPSVMAIYRSAWRLIEGLRAGWKDTPQLLSRISLAWSQALSAAIVMCLLVTRATTSSMAPSALDELDILLALFREAAPSCRSAATILDSINTLNQKAHESIDHAPPHGVSTITAAELDRIGGKTHLLAELGSLDRGDCEASPSVTFTSPTDYLQDVPTANMHPTIAQDMRRFDVGSPASGGFFDYPTRSQPTIRDQYTPENNSFYPATSFQVSAGFEQPPPILDATWQSFVEQLGF